MEKEIPKSISLNLTLFALSGSAGYLWLTMLLTEGNPFNSSILTGIILRNNTDIFAEHKQNSYIHSDLSR